MLIFTIRSYSPSDFFYEKGVCDFAVLDAEYDHSITLLGPPGAAKQKPIRFFNNPVIFVANYFFDSL